MLLRGCVCVLAAVGLWHIGTEWYGPKRLVVLSKHGKAKSRQPVIRNDGAVKTSMKKNNKTNQNNKIKENKNKETEKITDESTPPSNAATFQAKSEEKKTSKPAKQTPAPKNKLTEKTPPSDAEVLSKAGSEEKTKTAKTTQPKNNKTKQKNRTFTGRPKLFLIGERHTGTRWMTNHLQNCFDDLKVGYTSWKHWFQKDTRQSERGAVVVAIFRHVYQWTEAMRRFPHHSPAHMFLDWNDFVTKPWALPPCETGMRVFDEVTASRSKNKNFQPGQRIPCNATKEFFVNRGEKQVAFHNFTAATSSSLTVYEGRAKYDGNESSFENILALRSAKVRNFVSVGNYSNVKHFHIVRLEDVAAQGTARLIKQLSRQLNVTAKCKPSPGRGPKTPKPLPRGYVPHMKANVDWEAEALIGYTPTSYQASTTTTE